jgi:hypothetical protein
VRAPWMIMALAGLVSTGGAQQTTPAAVASQITDMLNLPRAVERARRAGIPSDRIQEVVDSLRRRRVPAADAEQIVRGEVDAVESGAPRENFGAFVNSQLARGLRGRDLAAAIHAEHARRGIGRSRGRPQSELSSPRPSGRGGAAGDTARGRSSERAISDTGVAKSRGKSAADTAMGKSKGRRP